MCSSTAAIYIYVQRREAAAKTRFPRGAPVYAMGKVKTVQVTDMDKAAFKQIVGRRFSDT